MVPQGGFGTGVERSTCNGKIAGSVPTQSVLRQDSEPTFLLVVYLTTGYFLMSALIYFKTEKTVYCIYIA